MASVWNYIPRVHKDNRGIKETGLGNRRRGGAASGVINTGGKEGGSSQKCHSKIRTLVYAGSSRPLQDRTGGESK